MFPLRSTTEGNELSYEQSGINPLYRKGGSCTFYHNTSEPNTAIFLAKFVPVLKTLCMLGLKTVRFNSMSIFGGFCMPRILYA